MRCLKKKFPRPLKSFYTNQGHFLSDKLWRKTVARNGLKLFNVTTTNALLGNANFVYHHANMGRGEKDDQSWSKDPEILNFHRYTVNLALFLTTHGIFCKIYRI